MERHVQAVRIAELESENAALRERVTQLDERTNTLSKEIVRAKFRGQQQVALVCLSWRSLIKLSSIQRAFFAKLLSHSEHLHVLSSMQAGFRSKVKVKCGGRPGTHLVWWVTGWAKKSATGLTHSLK